MFRRSAISVFALAGAFALGSLMPTRPAPVGAQPGGGQSRCVGVSAVQNALNPGGYRVFRAYDDGRIEAVDVSNDQYGDWKKIGK
jgi:hypothetical protein